MMMMMMTVGVGVQLQNVVTYGSTYVLVAVSIDRLDAIAQPTNYLRRGESPYRTTHKHLVDSFAKLYIE